MTFRFPTQLILATFLCGILVQTTALGASQAGDEVSDLAANDGDTSISSDELNQILAPTFAQLDARMVGLSNYLRRGLKDPQVRWLRETKPLSQAGVCEDGAPRGFYPSVGSQVRSCEDRYTVKLDAAWLATEQSAHPENVTAVIVHQLLSYHALRLPRIARVSLDITGDVDTPRGEDPIQGTAEGQIVMPPGKMTPAAVSAIAQIVRDIVATNLPNKQFQLDLKAAGFGYFYTVEQENAELTTLAALLVKERATIAMLNQEFSATVQACGARHAGIATEQETYSSGFAGIFKTVQTNYCVKPSATCQQVSDKFYVTLADMKSNYHDLDPTQYPDADLFATSSKLAAAVVQIQTLANSAMQRDTLKNHRVLISAGCYQSSEKAQDFIAGCYANTYQCTDESNDAGFYSAE